MKARHLVLGSLGLFLAWKLFANERPLSGLNGKNSFKISADYWNSLKDFEREFFISRFNKETISDLKVIVNAARRTFPGYVNIYGNGFVQLANNDVYVWSGMDSRLFYKFENGQINFGVIIKSK